MTDHSDVQHRTYHQPDPGRVELRDLEEDGEDGVFSVRMPIATTGEVRNQGDDPLSRDELDGMARQVESGGVGVFIDHGSNHAVAGSRYSATEKIGEWTEPETQERESDGETELVATARLMDPETLPAAMGPVREALASIKEQAKRGLALSSSIGWRDDSSYPGGVDLMEASIVGIPADPRTTSQDAPTAIAARALTAEDSEEFAERLEELRAVVMGPSDSEGREARDTVTDDDTSESGSSEERDDTTEEQTERDDAPDWAERMLEMQQQQTETLQSLADALREDDDDGDDDDEEDEGDDEEDDEDDEEQSADTDDDDGERKLEVDGEEVTAEDVRELREQLADTDPDDDVETQDASNDEDPSDDEDETNRAEDTDEQDDGDDLLSRL